MNSRAMTHITRGVDVEVAAGSILDLLIVAERE
jgi:hypothetical protein